MTHACGDLIVHDSCSCCVVPVQVPAGWNGFVYVYDGSGKISDTR